MKVFFLHFFDFSPSNGISKKIFAQICALEQCGCEVLLCHTKIEKNGTQKRVCGDDVIDDFGDGFLGRIIKWFRFAPLTRYIIDNNPDLLYVRSFYNATPSFVKMLKDLKSAGVKIVMEYPTYPYNGEFAKIPLKNKIPYYFNKYYGRKLKKYVNYIVTFSDYKSIEGIETIRISNGIDFSAVKVIDRQENLSGTLNLIGVAEIHYWHGFDRVIRGMADFYCKNPDKRVLFDIVGEGVEDDLNYLKNLTKELNLANYVTFHGNQYGPELDTLFDKADFGIASLARHRSGISKLKTLKNREYAARGIPFIYSEIDDDFEEMPYIIKAPADDSPIDIHAIADFHSNLKMTPEQIRETVSGTLSWKVQMQKVIDSIC